MGTKVVGYVRVSRVGGREGDSFLSPELQREQIEAVARREALDVVEVLEERDASGGDAKRPKWNEALGRVESGRGRRDRRLEPEPLDAEHCRRVATIKRIEDAGGRLYSATEQFGDDPSGRMYRNILLAIAEGERERQRAGFRSAVTSAIERGIHVASVIPFGYRRGADRRLAPDPDTTPVLQGLFERRAAGESWTKLARWAREQGDELSATGV